MSREIEALETLDEFEDGSYAAYLEYVDLKDNYANSDGLDIRTTTEETKIC